MAKKYMTEARKGRAWIRGHYLDILAVGRYRKMSKTSAVGKQASVHRAQA